MLGLSDMPDASWEMSVSISSLGRLLVQNTYEVMTKVRVLFELKMKGFPVFPKR